MEGNRWQNSGIKSGLKKRHGRELVMRVQTPMALINNILKNMFMTCVDGRQLMVKKAASKADML